MSDALPSVYVVDDDISVRESIEGLLRSAGMKVETFASAQEFRSRCRSQVPGCVVLDVRLPGLTGLDLQQELLTANFQVPIIFLTGHGDIPMSVRAIKSGALEFFTKPFDADALLVAIRQGMTRHHRTDKRRAAAPSGEMTGSGPAFKLLEQQVSLVAPTDSTVLILGETGTGKEMAARAIHARSHRASRPMVSVNCAAIQPSLMASELFGHEKGSFTGALHQRAGRFEQAEGGTIFLDEIGDLPSETQIALLRVLQERQFERVGGNQSIRVDVRVIAATNRDLKAAIAAGEFRSDLFYRLNVFPIHVPPLRKRCEDIPMLVEHFLRAHGSKEGRQIPKVDERSMETLRSYQWPGNIRELQNVVERWAIVSSGAGSAIDDSWFPRDEQAARTPPSDPPPDGTINLREYVESVERTLIARTMTEVDGNQSEAARRLGMSRGALLERLRKYAPKTG
jgi:DNA-binding NtrC family response regulator